MPKVDPPPVMGRREQQVLLRPRRRYQTPWPELWPDPNIHLAKFGFDTAENEPAENSQIEFLQTVYIISGYNFH